MEKNGKNELMEQVENLIEEKYKSLKIYIDVLIAVGNGNHQTLILVQQEIKENNKELNLKVESIFQELQEIKELINKK